MKTGDILKYMPTSTVGKATDIRERDGRVWIQLDRTKLYYDRRFLTPADASEYKEVSFKELERGSAEGRKVAHTFVEDIHEMEEDVDIRDMTPSGGG
jgi:hypothetical protein